jgi:hypothetical protein
MVDAAALRRAQDIRAYVREVKELCSGNANRPNTKQVRDWEEWALAQADRIDPVISGRYLESIKDPPS